MTSLLRVVLAAAAFAWLGAARAEPAAPRPDELAVQFVSTFSRADVDGLLERVTDDIEMLSLSDAGASVDVAGKAALRQFLERYFQRIRDVRSELEWTRVSGNRVVAEERVSWTSASGPRSRRSLSVYEFRDGKVRRVWYFPAESLASPAKPAS
ncbi:MAG: nuclear transport factor 2 family protein [Burkholderiales bacterium]|nr:nuclear transport factor 2 family protein [Burkholderiales bacterium]